MATKGFTQIDNDILEAKYSAGLNGTESDVFDLVMRETFGWQRHDGHPIGVRYFAQETGRDPSGVRAALGTLKHKKLLRQVSPPVGRIPATWKINEEIVEWETPSTLRSERGENPSTLRGEKPSTLPGVEWENPSTLNKEINTSKKKKERRSARADSRFQPLVDYAMESFAKRFPDMGLVMNEVEGENLKKMLRNHTGSGYSLEKLKAAWDQFLATENRFHKSRLLSDASIRHFCGSVNEFRVAAERAVAQSSGKTDEEYDADIRRLQQENPDFYGSLSA